MRMFAHRVLPGPQCSDGDSHSPPRIPSSGAVLGIQYHRRGKDTTESLPGEACFGVAGSDTCLLSAELQHKVEVPIASKTPSQPDAVAFSACFSQYVIPISRNMVVAVVRCSDCAPRRM